MQVAIRYGLILGVVNILLAVFGYLMGVEFAMSYYAVISGVISFAAIIFVCNRIKSENKGIIRYFDAVKLVFITLMLSYVIGSVYNYVFNNFIAPEYTEQIAKLSLDKAESLMESMGMPESDVDTAMEEARRESKKSLESPLMPFLQSIMVGAVVLFVIALIAAIFVQRKPAEDDFLYDDEVLDN
ncbi:putative membrane protein (DUF2232) [Bernardetia litoralis DSM 6794]|uniref:Putative membrane protein (DUF2232) n=1 Tax=Bernardetia litoralis (strain ATCC 23117 / DSM 6794 / NBRC 15988 / NCIMB 1366 / Fx l1 / Sio-4) TaxID=880071 RepID=I4AJK6_BERLS|nr:DUF4199 domain-containing protein [Bernardetia litoralis]AFM04141.1 putative membrane protein (DUF2232) [Bernardetia litoralis DSM 6794]